MTILNEQERPECIGEHWIIDVHHSVTLIEKYMYKSFLQKTIHS